MQSTGASRGPAESVLALSPFVRRPRRARAAPRWWKALKIAVYNRRGQVVRYAEQRGALPKRVTLIEHDSNWTEIERDAVIMLECHLPNRGSWRPGDVETTPLTLAHIQHWLRKTYARRSGRDYARDVLATLLRIGLLEDTGQVLKPRQQPPNANGRSYWWRVFRVVPISLLREGSYRRTKGAGSPLTCSASPRTVSLRRWLIRQGVIRRKSGPPPAPCSGFSHTQGLHESCRSPPQSTRKPVASQAALTTRERVRNGHERAVLHECHDSAHGRARSLPLGRAA